MPSLSKTQIPTLVGKSLKKESLSLIAFVRQLDTADATVGDCEHLLKSLNDLSLECENPLRNLSALRAELFWLCGSILNQLYPIQKGKTGLLTHGDWGPWLKAHGYSSSWADYARWASVLMPRTEVRRITVEAMKRKVAEHTGRLKGKKKGKVPSTTTESRRKGWRITSDFMRLLSEAEGRLENITENLPDAVDLLDDADVTLEVINDAEKAHERTGKYVSKLESQLAWVKENATEEKEAIDKALAEQDRKEMIDAAS